MAEVRDNPDRSRFELTVDGETAFVDYATEAGLLVLLQAPRTVGSARAAIVAAPKKRFAIIRRSP